MKPKEYTLNIKLTDTEGKSREYEFNIDVIRSVPSSFRGYEKLL